MKKKLKSVYTIMFNGEPVKVDKNGKDKLGWFIVSAEIFKIEKTIPTFRIIDISN
jgi:hypothetical protein